MLYIILLICAWLPACVRLSLRSTPRRFGGLGPCKALHTGPLCGDLRTTTAPQQNDSTEEWSRFRSCLGCLFRKNSQFVNVTAKL